MAGRKFGLSGTLNRNKKEVAEDLELPKKIELPKKSKNIEKVQEKVETLHQEETRALPKAAPKTVAKKPRTTKGTTKPSAKKTIAKKSTRKTVKDSDMRLTFDIPRSLHKKLKIKAITNEVTIKDYLIGLIEKELK